MLPEKIDYSVFDETDYLNIILQRSEVLHDVPKPGKLVNAWSEGDEIGLLKVVSEKKEILAERALTDIQSEFETIRASLGARSPKRIADIGCGYGFFSFLAGFEFGSELLLVDIEENDHRHFGFASEGAAYSSLERAVQFLVANGISNEKISVVNPVETEITSSGKVDLVISLLACGFHFPVETYMDYFSNNVVSGGKIILDIRQRKFDEQTELLSKLGEIEVIGDSWKNRSRVLITKTA